MLQEVSLLQISWTFFGWSSGYFGHLARLKRRAAKNGISSPKKKSFTKDSSRNTVDDGWWPKSGLPQYWMFKTLQNKLENGAGYQLVLWQVAPFFRNELVPVSGSLDMFSYLRSIDTSLSNDAFDAFKRVGHVRFTGAWVWIMFMFLLGRRNVLIYNGTKRSKILQKIFQSHLDLLRWRTEMGWKMKGQVPRFSNWEMLKVRQRKADRKQTCRPQGTRSRCRP